MISLSAVAILAEHLDHGLRVPVDDRQQNAGRPVGNPASLLPLLKGAGSKTEAVGELLTAQPEPLAQSNDPAGRGIVEDPARQLRLAADMRENLAQHRFDLPPEFGAFRRHGHVVLIVDRDLTHPRRERPSQPASERPRAH